MVLGVRSILGILVIMNQRTKIVQIQVKIKWCNLDAFWIELQTYSHLFQQAIIIKSRVYSRNWMLEVPYVICCENMADLKKKCKKSGSPGLPGLLSEIKPVFKL